MFKFIYLSSWIIKFLMKLIDKNLTDLKNQHFNKFDQKVINFFRDIKYNQMMQKKDLQKQQRRKRKDPQSRDFKCKCGKSYLSYAAVYTHVKNKHNDEKQFADSIVKPEIKKQKRGRPRDKKKIIISSETQILSICEQTTLLIYEQLKQHKDKFSHHIVLEGNQEMNQQSFRNQYKRLNQNKQVRMNLFENGEKSQNRRSPHDNQNSQEDQEDHKIFEKFLKGVIKHFSAQIAARTSYVVNYLAELNEEINFEDKNEVEPHINELNDLDLWEGQNEINTIIYDAMLRWLQVFRKDADVGEE